MPERTWCEACRDHFGADHYTEDGSHRCGPEFGPAGADMAKLREFDALEARASALADALRDLLGREAAVSRMREMPSHTAESLRCVEDALERSIVAARSALADAAVPLPHKENT